MSLVLVSFLILLGLTGDPVAVGFIGCSAVSIFLGVLLLCFVLGSMLSFGLLILKQKIFTRFR